MKAQIFLCVIALSLLAPGCVSTGAVRPLGSAAPESREEARESIASPRIFPDGVRLVYLMAWNGIPVGSITAESGDTIEYRGRRAYVVKITTESNRFLSGIYRVEDIYISYIDTETMTSLRYEADRKEGRYRKHVIVEYDMDKLEATYTNLVDGSVKTCAIEREVQDPVSAMCYFMTMPVKRGERVKITVNLNEKNYGLYGDVESLDLITLSALGCFPAFKVRPCAELDGREVRKGRAWMYFAADGTRYPLYGVVVIPFGKVTATLREINRSDKGRAI